MITFPNPKLNIGLDILRKRPDGYHDIDTLMVPYEGMRDLLEIVPAEKPEMKLYGIPVDGDATDNLCFRAWKMMAEEFGIQPVAIYLYKNIPSGAGLGGGSADAAFTLLMLNDMFGLGLDKPALAELAARLGSDCPFFIYNRPMLCRGRGEIMSPFDIDLCGLRFEVVVPPIHVSTREAYAGVTPGVPVTPLEESLRRPVREWKECVRNDFEKSVFAAHPQLADAKEDMYRHGAIYAAMSGSGSSIFGIFQENVGIFV